MQSFFSHTNALTLVFGFLFLVSCNIETVEPKDQIAWAELSRSTNHFDYARFIQAHPSSQYVDSAIHRYFFFRDSLWDLNGVPMGDCFGNCANVILGAEGRVLFEHEISHADSLHDLALEFMINKNREPTKPDFKEINIPYSDKMGHISRGHFQFFLVHDSLQPLPLQEVVVPVSNAINSYKDTLAISWYGKRYHHISELKQHALDSILDLRFIFFDNYMPPPPPMNPGIEEITRIEEIEFSE